MANAKESEATSVSSKPVKVLRVRGISASIFANRAKSDQGRELTFHKVAIQRTYRDEGEFKITSSFSRDDLPIVRLLSERAWQWILDEEAARGKDDPEA
jgi:hypothetical protein